MTNSELQINGNSFVIRNLSFVIGLAALLFLAECSTKEEAHADVYTCPMHPTVLSDKPGACPICGMDLVKKTKSGGEVEIDENLTPLLNSPNETVLSNIKIIKGVHKKIPAAIEAQGIITYDPRNVYTISSRVGGRLEKVYLKYSFQKVKKGQKIAEIYSPEMLAVQRELLFLLEKNPENESLIKRSIEKLLLLGATEFQVDDLIKKRALKETFTLYSPYDGYLMNESEPAFATALSSGAGMNVDMNAVPVLNQANDKAKASIIREGNYVTSGQILFNVVNTSMLFVELNVSSQGSLINMGDEVELDLGEGNLNFGKIDFVQPFFNQGQEFLTARVYLKRTGNLRIGRFVKALIKSNASESLWVPKEAVIDLGLKKIVFIKDKKAFKPRTVITGNYSPEIIEIKQGLLSFEEIAANAQYLVDSEGFINAEN